tara:strand:- start:1813 stop:4128 length:2316 start_codon:yes stop_codon:yes gene_type:complete
MAFGKKPCCDDCAREPSKARISGNPIAHLFQMGGGVMFADGGEAKTDLGAADPEYTSIWPGSEYPVIGPFSHLSGALLRPFLRREVLTEEETRRVGDDTIEINPQTGMQEVMATLQTFPGEYGPIEMVNPLTDWPTSMDIMLFGIENWLKAKAFLSTPEGREQALDIAQQLPSQAIEGAQDYMTQQVDMADRGYQETYDPETGEIKDFNVPLIAAEIMAGSLSRPAVEVAGNELFAGMAVRPKRAVVRPTSTFPEEIRYGYGTGEIVDTEAANIREYQALLIDNLIQLGVDEKLASEVGAKANKYFMTELGTADDRLRQRMLQGDIEPQVWHGDDSNWSREKLDRINKPLIGARRGNAEARRKFEGAYDRATGVQRTIVGDDLSPHSSDIPAAVSEADQMLQEGVPSDLITNTMGTLRSSAIMGGFGHDPLSLYPQLTYTMAEAREQWPGAWDEMPEYLRRAYEQEEMVYEIDPTDFSFGLEFLNPQELALKLRGLSDEQLKGGAFPDLVVDAQSSIIPLDLQQTQLARTLNSLSSKVTAEERNARVPTELKTEVGVTPVYETPNRAWYSLDTDGAVELEGGLMNHSIAGYSSKSDHQSYTPGQQKDFAEGNIRVFSLREKDGQPRITTDVVFPILGPPRYIGGPPRYIGGSGPRVLDAYGYNNANVSDEYLEELFALWKDLGVGPTSAMPDGVQGSGEQYQMYLEYDQVFNFTDAVDHIDSGLTKRIDPETGEAFIPNPDDDGFAEGGIVSLVKGGDPNKHRRNQQRGNN